MLSAEDELREKYIAERPKYQRLTKALENIVAKELPKSGVAASVAGRTKDVHKLVLKAMRADSPDYAAIGDKAGVRITVAYSDLVEPACQVVESQLRVLDCEDKREAVSPDSLGYLATHFEVGLPSDHPLIGEDPWFETARSELQVLTRAESLWADASHELLYKPTVDLPGREQRSVLRLVALIEIVDSELGRARRVRSELDGKGVFGLIQDLDRFHFQWTSRPPDRQLTAEVIERLVDADDAFIRHCTSQLEAWFESNRAKLVQLASNYEDDNRASPMLFQPEATLIFLMLDTDPYKTRDMWNQFAEEAILDRLESIWGFRS